MSKLAWNDINWTLVQERISRQQRRVYRASMEGNRAKTHAIQRRIICSLDARLLAVRRVTTENKERNTVGVDGVRTISDVKKIKLAYQLKLDGKVSPIKRTYTPRPGRSEKRPVGIPIIEDRAKQMLAKFALEPEWEAIFEPNSYGFRPGRSCHDAVATIFFSLRGRSQYVLEAEIQKCFDRIDHDKLLNKLSTFDLLNNQIRAWLKADIMVGSLNRPDEVFQIIEGTLQDGIISPLLANIALHGLGEYVKDWYANTWYPTTGQSSKVAKKDCRASIGFSRYASNFIITASERIEIEQIENQVSIWLKNEAGLKLSKTKTRIVNSTEGFEFLGFQIITIKQSNEKFKIKIHPSKASKSRIIQQIRKIIQRNKSASSYNLINLLSSRIISWANYFRYSECNQDFSKIDYLIFNQIRAWVFRRKSKNLKSRTKLKLKYFPEGKTYRFRGRDYINNWILNGQTLTKKGEKKENFLPKMAWINSSQYIKIKGNASPYDGNNLYWAERVEKHSGFNHRISKLIRIQEGYCKLWGRKFTPTDFIEAGHMKPKSKGRSDRYKNLQTIQKHCHIQKSRLEKSVSK
jgi:group II intron reverse transcriptase/maturase